MKIFIILVLSTLLNINNCNAQQKKDRLTNKNDTVMSQEYGQIEKYDFTATKNGTILVERNNEWVILKQGMSSGGAQYIEYAPAKYFYDIVKNFYPNGMIRSRGKGLGSVAFGIREEFDENGKLTELVDEDKKFGKIKPTNIVELLEKEGWFNRETGENKVIPESPLPTNGYFTMKLMGNFNIIFTPAKIENGVEVEPPQWVVSIIRQSQFYFMKALYKINGNTGEFSKVIDDTKIYDEY